MLETVRRLERRIEARFPQRGLRRVAAGLGGLVAEVADDAHDLQRRLGRTRTLSRVGAAVVLAVTVVALVLATRSALGEDGVHRGVEWLPLIETTVNDLVFAAIALFFVWTLPERLHRRRLLALLHRLRSMAHVIDMHQLTKDPERTRPEFRPTAASAEVDLDGPQMEAYLDYCSEMLSLVGKAAALVAEESQDPLVLATISDIEELTTSMSRKIWQKIDVLARLREVGEDPQGGRPRR